VLRNGKMYDRGFALGTCKWIQHVHFPVLLFSYDVYVCNISKRNKRKQVADTLVFESGKLLYQ